ncbi:MAG: serine/threonine-protein kinase [Bryobacteraceae bacterium]
MRKSCGGNEDLRAELQSLLDGAGSDDGFLEGSPLSAFTTAGASLTSGSMVGRFRIIELLGRGGMGDVYKAHDTRLDRAVALKICRERFTERFDREARIIASLNHPNICTLYDVGPNYLVMEFVDGRPLRGPMPVERALQYGVQAADALWAAHKKGVVHRDFKPGNVLVDRAGVKLLDFGLAKMMATETGTAAEAITQTNQIPGTLRYMAPEQLEGKPADARSDLFAFGLVLFEAITGVAVFQASSQASLISAIMKDEPPPLVSPLGPVPPGLVRLLQKCMAKDPDERWQTAADLRDELRWIAQTHGGSSGASALPPDGNAKSFGMRRRRTMVLASLLGAVAVAGGFVWQRMAGARATPGIPVVVLMDTPAADGVYDPETRKRAGTNADDLSEALASLPISVHKETVSAAWNREYQLATQQPALIVIHRSLFVHALVFEFRGEAGSEAHQPPWPNPSQDADFYRRLSRIGRDKLDVVLGYFAATNPGTRFLVYSRDWSQASRRRWVEGVTNRFPILRGRVKDFELEPVEGIASFRQAPNVKRIREEVAAMLAAR